LKQKFVVKVALIMIVVFGATILLYPTLFSSDRQEQAPIEAPPIQEPVSVGK